MRYSQLIKFGFVAIAMVWLQGCTTTQPGQMNEAVGSELSGENLDLLFATEFPVATKEEALMKAARAYRDGEADKAQFYLVRALKFDANDTAVLMQIGNLHAQHGNMKLAARAFRFTLEQDPEHAGALQGMGLLYFRNGDNDQAKTHLELAVARLPGLWRAHNALGVIADAEKDYSLAQRHYDAALEIQPHSDSVLINRGYSKYLNEEYHGAALDFYTVSQRSNNEKAWRNLGLVYAKQGWYDDALETFLNVGDERDAYNETGAIAMDNGDYTEAMHYLTEAVRISPTYFAQAEKNIAQLRKKDTRSYIVLE